MLHTNARPTLELDVVLGPLYRSISGTVAYDRSYMQQRVPLSQSHAFLESDYSSAEIKQSFKRSISWGPNRQQVQFSESK